MNLPHTTHGHGRCFALAPGALTTKSGKVWRASIGAEWSSSRAISQGKT
jgi:hypothetical protein